MTMTVTLYNEIEINGVERGGIWSSKTEQSTYFNNRIGLQRECKTVPLGEDILFSGTIEEVRQYAYGSIDYGDGFRYYFYIYDYDFKSTETTVIMYTVDVWETYWQDITLMRAHMTRAPSDLGRPVMAIDYDRLVYTDRRLFSWVQVEGGWRSDLNQSMASVSSQYSYWGSGNPQTYYASGKAYRFLRYQDGSGNAKWNDLQSDLYHAAVYPSLYGMLNASWITGDYTLSVYDSQVQVCHQKLNSERGVYVREQNYHPSSDKSTTLNKTRTHTDVVKDMHGNVIFEPAFGEEWQIDRIEYRAGIGSSSCLMVITESSTGETRYIPLPGESLDNMVDTWSEYYYRQRQTDIDTRSLQNQQQLTQGLMGSGTTALEGALMGSIVPGVGTAAGQAIGQVVGVVGSLGNYAANEGVFNDQQQQIIDTQQKKALDTLALIGYANMPLEVESVTSWRYPTCPQGIYRYDYNNKAMIEKDISMFGYPVDYYTETFTNLRRGHWKGDVEVYAPLPKAWRDQVQQRFANGIYLM